MRLGIDLGMKAKDFVVVRRPMLAKITKHPTIAFADYERRLESMQFIMQSIQQAYLGTRERAVIQQRNFAAIFERATVVSYFCAVGISKTGGVLDFQVLYRHGFFPQWLVLATATSLAPSGHGYHAFERMVVQSYWIAFAFHGKPQDTPRQLVRFHGRVADRLERKPGFIESRLQNDERLRIKGVVVEPTHGSILNLTGTLFVIRQPSIQSGSDGVVPTVQLVAIKSAISGVPMRQSGYTATFLRNTAILATQRNYSSCLKRRGTGLGKAVGVDEIQSKACSLDRRSVELYGFAAKYRGASLRSGVGRRFGGSRHWGNCSNGGRAGVAPRSEGLPEYRGLPDIDASLSSSRGCAVRPTAGSQDMSRMSCRSFMSHPRPATAWS
jgi:hypothetical protein